MTYDCFATPDKKNTCDLKIRDAFFAEIKIKNSTTENAVNLLKSAVLNYQSILCEEDGPIKDFQLSDLSNGVLEINGNLKYFSICLLKCDLISLDKQESFVRELKELIEKTTLTSEQRKSLLSYEANVKKALGIINFGNESSDGSPDKTVSETLRKESNSFFSLNFVETPPPVKLDRSVEKIINQLISALGNEPAQWDACQKYIEDKKQLLVVQQQTLSQK